MKQNERKTPDIVTTSMTLIVKAEMTVLCLSFNPFQFQNFSIKIPIVNSK